MWITVLCVLAVPESLQPTGVLGIRVFPEDRRQEEVQEGRGVFQEIQDQDGSFSELVNRGSSKLINQRHEFELKIQHPSGEDTRGHVLEQKEHHAFENFARERQHESTHSDFHHGQIDGEWRGINNFGTGEYVHQQGKGINSGLWFDQEQQHREEIEIARARQHFGRLDQSQTQAAFGQQHHDHQNQDFIQVHQESRSFVKDQGRNIYSEARRDIKNEDTTNVHQVDHNSQHDIKDISAPNSGRENFNFPEDLRKEENLSSVSINEETFKPHHEVKTPLGETVNKVSFKMKQQTSEADNKSHLTEAHNKYSSDEEKKNLYAVEEHDSQSDNIYKIVPFKPSVIFMPKPHHFLIKKTVPFHYEKEETYSPPLRFSMDKPHDKPSSFYVPKFKPIPYGYTMAIGRKLPYSLTVPMNKRYAFIPKSYKGHFERPRIYALEHSAPAPLFFLSQHQRDTFRPKNSR